MRNFLILIALLLPFMMGAQELSRNCSTMEHLEMQKAQDPFLEAKMAEIENETQKFVRNFDGNSRQVVTIPVVVHVIYKTNAENISDAQVLSQIQVLNDDFRRTNNDRTNYWSQAADTEIEFCMATVDPDGNSTNGITRTSTTKSSWGTDDSMKKSRRGGVDPWDPSSYLNVWVCNLSGGILGYAQFPGGSAATDGVVCLTTAFGTTGNVGAPFDLGRTTTHEVGHYLNLRHIWGDGGCNVDDYVSDTPESDGANYGCATGHTSCSTRDMVENYMDYSDDACMNLFTAGQKARMMACLSSSRSGLGASTACSGGGPTTPTCTDGIQNGNETGVDCGGSCAPCPVAGPCDAPSNLYSQSRKGGKSARMSWDGVNSATSYNVRLRQVGASSWSTGSTSSTQMDASVVKNADYEWGVQSDCGGDLSSWSSSTFTAGTSSRLVESLSFELFPNPASQTVNIDLYETVDAQLTIHDMLGRTVMAQTVSQYNTVDVSNLDNGVYLVRIVTAEGESSVQKLMVAE